MRKFTCSCCGETFDVDDEWTVADVHNEYVKNFPEDAARNVNRTVVCDDCYLALTGIMPR